MNSKVTGEGGAEAEVKKALQFSPTTATFEHRHENKTCSACPEDQLLSDFQTFFLSLFILSLFLSFFKSSSIFNLFYLIYILSF